jgi:hypothetical protein
LIAALQHATISAEDPYKTHQIIAIPVATNESFGAPKISADRRVAKKTNVVYPDFSLESR